MLKNIALVNGDTKSVGSKKKKYLSFFHLAD